MPQRLLVIGNKRYSSWSLRAWIALKQLNLDFEEKVIWLYKGAYKDEILTYSPAGKVPILIDGGIKVFDTLAILEFLNETYARGQWLPQNAVDRAMARSVSAEMHSGFQGMRNLLSTNFPREPKVIALDDAARADVARILDMWETLRGEHQGKGPWLFGQWGIPDCMFIPVATRFHIYAVDMTRHPRAKAYKEALLALPAYKEWVDGAKKETERLAHLEK